MRATGCRRGPGCMRLYGRRWLLVGLRGGRNPSLFPLPPCLPLPALPSPQAIEFLPPKVAEGGSRQATASILRVVCPLFFPLLYNPPHRPPLQDIAMAPSEVRSRSLAGYCLSVLRESEGLTGLRFLPFHATARQPTAAHPPPTTAHPPIPSTIVNPTHPPTPALNPYAVALTYNHPPQSQLAASASIHQPRSLPSANPSSNSLHPPDNTMPTTQIKAHELLSKSKADLHSQLIELKQELLQLRVAKITGGNTARLTKMLVRAVAVRRWRGVSSWRRETCACLRGREKEYADASTDVPSSSLDQKVVALHAPMTDLGPLTRQIGQKWTEKKLEKTCPRMA